MQNSFLDTFGVLFAASSPKIKLSTLSIDPIKEQDGEPESSIAGHNFKVSCVNAALMNRTIADTIELYDS